jgi:hypothetical protein
MDCIAVYMFLPNRKGHTDDIVYIQTSAFEEHIYVAGLDGSDRPVHGLVAKNAFETVLKDRCLELWRA